MIVYARLGDVLAKSCWLMLFSSGEPCVCLGRLSEEDDEEWREVDDVLGRRLRLARAVVVLSRAMAAMDSRLFFGWDPRGAKVASV